MMRVSVLSPLLLSASLVMACADPSAQDDCQANPTPVTGVDGGVACGQPFALNPEDGVRDRFAVKVVQYLHMSSAGLVETDTLASAIGWAEFVHEPGALSGRMDLKLCHLEVPKIQIPGQPQASSLELAPGALDYVPPPGAAYAVSGSSTCDSFVTDPNVVLVAARLVNDLSDPLPTDVVTQTCANEMDTECLFDQDRDGKPAVTFIARNFPAINVDEVYATLRSWVAMDGLVATPDLILGTAYFGLEISAVGCRIEPLGGGEERECNAEEADVIASITPVVSQTPDVDSTFVAVRVDRTTNCDDVIEHADRLFGR